MTFNLADFFDSSFYLQRNNEFANFTKIFNLNNSSAFKHFRNQGQFENRDPSVLFNSEFYLQQYADVRQAVNDGKISSAFQHFRQFGQFENREPSRLFNANFYLQRYPDVRQAIAEGKFRSAFQHFIEIGQFQNRQPSTLFNPNYYLDLYPDVRQEITQGRSKSAFQHYVQVGATQGRIAAPGTRPGSFVLQLLHASDFEAGVAALDDAPRFSSVLNALRAQYPNQTLTLSSGDNYIPSPFFAASSDPSLRPVLGRENIGRGDIAILNALGIQASAFGNHEFDQGTNQVRVLIARDREYTGTAFPFLGANLDFSPDANLRDLVVADGREANTIPNSIAKSTVVDLGGERFGIVGATTPTLRSISSPGDVRVSPSNPQDLDALAASIQPSVDALTGQGINKVILLAHMQQLDIEVNLASRLRNVDIIVAGGSHTLLADESDRLRVGDTAAGVYPIIRTSASGEPIAVVNTAANYRYVGRLVAEFDPQGRIVPASFDPLINGAYATDDRGVADTGNFAPDPKIVQVTQALRNVIVTKDSQLFGRTNVYLNGDRNSVRTEETNLGNLTADASLAAVRRNDPGVVISIKNGGGIRESIGAVVGGGGNDPNAGQRIPPVANPIAGKEAGQISQLDIENSLRFNNQLTLLTLTAQQLKQVLEHGVSDTAPGRTPGRFPQVGGLAFSFDPNRPANSRVVSIALKDSNGRTTDTIVQNGQVVGDPNRTFRIVTLNFLAGGGDGYPFPNFPATNRIDTGLGEQQALRDFLTANFNATPFNIPDVDVAQDTRIQNLAARNDTVIAGISRTATRVADVGDILTGDMGNAPHPLATDILPKTFFPASSPLSFLPISHPASMSTRGAFNFDLNEMGNGERDAIPFLPGVPTLTTNQPAIF
ncbi:bifunctional metallophosphatase/5'-nucleotidase [Microseira sp. BLCC-F43]|uniref:bifunctional metallophosphatase/5'-nucleotidase n=1 Tax=Microseira sp. BLCC-F43 TaxID=3153602 RepID=UPI0035BAB930